VRARSRSVRVLAGSTRAMRVVAIAGGAIFALLFLVCCEAALLSLVVMSWPTGG